MSSACKSCGEQANEDRMSIQYRCQYCGYRWWCDGSELRATLATREAQLVEMCDAVDAMAYGQDGKRLTVKKCIRWAKKARALIKELDGK